MTSSLRRSLSAHGKNCASWGKASSSAWHESVYHPAVIGSVAGTLRSEYGEFQGSLSSCDETNEHSNSHNAISPIFRSRLDSKRLAESFPSTTLMSTPSQPTVAIVGGGLAGLAAACALSNVGFRVTLFEKRPFLGGRASSYEHPGTGEVVDNCQHVLFRCCTNLLEFYERIGVPQEVRWYET